MGHTNYRTLIDQGRKAGLRTSELYSALASRHPDTSDFVNGHADSNGFAETLDVHGHPIYKPQDGTENR
jgi:hypothetical protein